MLPFLTTNQTAPPLIPALAYALMMSLVVLSIYGAVNYHDHAVLVKAFKWIQFVQLLALYAWYIGFHLPLANSLPLYHCRLAMFAVIFLPDKWKIKQYFAILGASGAIFALGYLVFDPYDFPHITSFSFLIGHYALLVNSLIYLFNHYDKHLLKKSEIIAYTLMLNLFLIGVNQATGGNYGLLARPPLISGDNPLVNYSLVSFILIMALLLFDELFKRNFFKKSIVKRRYD